MLRLDDFAALFAFPRLADDDPLLFERESPVLVRRVELPPVELRPLAIPREALDERERLVRDFAERPEAPLRFRDVPLTLFRELLLEAPRRCELLFFCPERPPFLEEPLFDDRLFFPRPIPITSLAAVVSGLRVEIALPATAPRTPPITEPTAAPVAVPSVVGIGGMLMLPTGGTLISELDFSDCWDCSSGISGSGFQN